MDEPVEQASADLEIQLTEKSSEQIRAFCSQHSAEVLTILFCDQVGSTATQSREGNVVAFEITSEHRRLFREILSEFGGQEVETAGDSFLCVFSRPSLAVRFALHVHARLRQERERMPGLLQVRIGIDQGEIIVQRHDTGPKSLDIYGLQVSLAARLTDLGGAGQTLCSRRVFNDAVANLNVRDLEGLSEIGWEYHGPYVFKGSTVSHEVCEVGEKAHAPLSKPEGSTKARPVEAVDVIYGWRPGPDAIVPGTHWRLERILGEGGFGEVWLAQDKDQPARKTVFKFCTRLSKVKSLRREKDVFDRLLDTSGRPLPGIVEVLGAHDDSVKDNAGPPYYIQLAYCAGGDLREWIDSKGKATTLRVRLDVALQMVRALERIHERGFVHRDIKPSNFLIDGETGGTPDVKLCDFGIGQAVLDEAISQGLSTSELAGGGGQFRLGAETVQQAAGTFLFIAPELVLTKSGSGSSVSKQAESKADIYSVGVTLYQLFAGSSEVVPGTGLGDLQDPILREDVEACLETNPGKRPTAAELAARLQRYDQRRRGRSMTRTGVVAAIVGIILAAAFYAAWYWDAYSRSMVYYAEAIGEHSGRPVGMTLVGSNDAHRRMETFRIHSFGRRGLIHQIDRLNGSGELLPEKTALTGMVNDTLGVCVREYGYDADDNVIREIHKNKYGEIETMIQHSASPTGNGEYVADFRASDGLPKPNSDGAFHVRTRRDERGFVVSLMNLDAFNQPKADERGLYGWAYERDANGFVTKESVLGFDGKPSVTREGWASKAIQRDERGRSIEVSYLDPQGQPIYNAQGYTTQRFSYDEVGNVIEEAFLGESSTPVNTSDGYARIRYAYDAQGNRIETAYWGADGEPAISTDGYAKETAEYDGRGNRIARQLFAADGSPAFNTDGYSQTRLKYDGHNNVVEVEYLGADGKPTYLKDGYAMLRRVYDEHGNQTETQFLDDQGEISENSNGVGVNRITYNDFHQVIRNESLDRELKPAFHYVVSDGERITFPPIDIFTYDQRRRIARYEAFAEDGVPALTSMNISRIDFTYDEFGNTVREAYFGVDSLPALDDNGVAGQHSVYDELGREIESSFFGVNGERVLDVNGNAGHRSKYDARGNVIETTWFGLDGKPVVDSAGYATERTEYDERGLRTKVSYFDEYGTPTSAVRGFASQTFQYDERGNTIKAAMYDDDGELLHPPECAIVQFRYDVQGNAIEIRFCDNNGHDMIYEGFGYALYRTKYDEFGREVERSFFGANDEPLTAFYGFHRIAREYDAYGIVTDEQYYDTDGEAVPVDEVNVEAIDF